MLHWYILLVYRDGTKQKKTCRETFAAFNARYTRVPYTIYVRQANEYKTAQLYLEIPWWSFIHHVLCVHTPSTTKYYTFLFSDMVFPHNLLMINTAQTRPTHIHTYTLHITQYTRILYIDVHNKYTETFHENKTESNSTITIKLKNKRRSEVYSVKRMCVLHVCLRYGFVCGCVCVCVWECVW